MKALIYIRTSTPRQKLSLEAQVASCKKYCENEGIDIHGVYTDIGKSGRLPVDKRPGLDQLLSEIGYKDVLICNYPDRLSRDPIISGKIREIIRIKGASLFFTCDLDEDFVKIKKVLLDNMLSAINIYNKAIGR